MRNLQEELVLAKNDLFKARLEKKLSKSENFEQIKKAKKNIAKILLEIKEQEYDEEVKKGRRK